MTDQNDDGWIRRVASTTDRIAEMRDYQAQQDLIAAQKRHADALWADRQLAVIEPGNGPDDLLWRECVLYEIVQATGGKALARGYGPTPEQIVARLRDRLDDMADERVQELEQREGMPDSERAGNDRWRLRMVLGAASDLHRMGLIEVEPPHIAKIVRPTHGGCALVQRWKRIWAEPKAIEHAMADRRHTHKLFGAVGSPLDPNLCFVLMPFRPDFDEVWQDVIQKAVSEAGLKCVRADEIYGIGAIIHDIWEQIVTARVLVAELTGKNPNVFYELGLAHALERDVVLLTQDMSDVPFDLRHLRVIHYGTTRRGLEKLEQDLQKMLAEILKGITDQAAAAPQQPEPLLPASRESQSHRDLAIEPYLTFRIRTSFMNGLPYQPQLELENIGQGPALNCLYCARAVAEGQEVMPETGARERTTQLYRFPLRSPYSSPLHLGPGRPPEQASLMPMSTLESDAEVLLADLPSQLGILQVAVCEDDAGTRYREVTPM